MVKLVEIEQDDKFQKKLWKFQSAGKIFLAVIIISAVIGLLGSGPFSHREITAGKTTIKYPYLARFSHPENISFSYNQ